MALGPQLDQPPTLEALGVKLKIVVLFGLIASLAALSQTEIWTLMSEPLRRMSGIFQIGSGMLLISVLLVIVCGIMMFRDNEWESYTLTLTWTVFVVAAYPLSGMDWLEALLGMGRLTTLASVGPMMILGVGLMAVTLMYRSINHLRQVISNLMDRGAPTEDLEAIVDPMIWLYLKLTAITMGIVSVVAAGALMASGQLSGLEASPVTMMAMAIVSVVTLAVVYLAIMRSIGSRASDL